MIGAELHDTQGESAACSWSASCPASSPCPLLDAASIGLAVVRITTATVTATIAPPPVRRPRGAARGPGKRGRLGLAERRAGRDAARPGDLERAPRPARFHPGRNWVGHSIARRGTGDADEPLTARDEPASGGDSDAGRNHDRTGLPASLDLSSQPPSSRVPVVHAANQTST